MSDERRQLAILRNGLQSLVDLMFRRAGQYADIGSQSSRAEETRQSEVGEEGSGSRADTPCVNGWWDVPGG